MPNVYQVTNITNNYYLGPTSSEPNKNKDKRLLLIALIMALAFSMLLVSMVFIENHGLADYLKAVNQMTLFVKELAPLSK